MPNPPDSFCSRCGTQFEDVATYPRVCPNPDCRAETYANPVPVAVVLLPVSHDGRTGLLVIRRGIEPGKGKLALPGGFVDAGETWQRAAAREILEETHIQVAASWLRPFWFCSTEPKPNRVLLFASCDPVEASKLPDFSATNETLERGLVFGPMGLDEVFAFDLHAAAARRWFVSQQLSGEHEYSEV